jgi:hypothetical protein
MSDADDVRGELPDYPDRPKFRRFVEELTAAGFEDRLSHYRGRNYYEGPAVEVDRDDEQAVIRATSMRLRSDNMGRDGLIFYPAE